MILIGLVRKANSLVSSVGMKEGLEVGATLFLYEGENVDDGNDVFVLDVGVNVMRVGSVVGSTVVGAFVGDREVGLFVGKGDGLGSLGVLPCTSRFIENTIAVIATITLCFKIIFQRL